MVVSQVICVRKQMNASGTHEHIAQLGLGSGNIYSELISVEEAVRRLRRGDRLFTVSPTTGKMVDLIEAGCEHCGHRPYVRTEADGILDNNLLNLPNCG